MDIHFYDGLKSNGEEMLRHGWSLEEDVLKKIGFPVVVVSQGIEHIGRLP